MFEAAVQSTITTGSTSSFLQGYPSVVGGVESYLDSFAQLLSVAVTDAARFATLDIRKAARSRDDGWRELADNLHVVFDGVDFVYVVQGVPQEQVNALEYGDGSTPPTGFLRKTTLRHTPILGSMVSAALTGQVPSA